MDEPRDLTPPPPTLPCPGHRDVPFRFHYAASHSLAVRDLDKEGGKKGKREISAEEEGRGAGRGGAKVADGNRRWKERMRIMGEGCSVMETI